MSGGTPAFHREIRRGEPWSGRAQNESTRGKAREKSNRHPNGEILLDNADAVIDALRLLSRRLSVSGKRCFDDGRGVPWYRDAAQKLEACSFEETRPVPFGPLSATGDSQHVQVAHQASLQIEINAIDRVGENELHHQDATVAWHC